MTAQKLDFSALTKAIGSMEEALNAYQKKPTDNFIRDASIQRFEYTYELCHKFLRRYLALNEPSAEVVHEMSFPELIRTSSLRGLIGGDWGKWQIYRNARNVISHTYDESIANKVLLVIPDFLQDAKYLLTALQRPITTR